MSVVRSIAYDTCYDGVAKCTKCEKLFPIFVFDTKFTGKAESTPKQCPSCISDYISPIIERKRKLLLYKDVINKLCELNTPLGHESALIIETLIDEIEQLHNQILR